MTERQRLERPSTFYATLDSMSGAIIIMMILFAPWAFGTTEEWSMNIMNAGGYLLGGMLLLKQVHRKQNGFSPARWGEDGGLMNNPAAVKNTRLLAGLTVVILAYCFISAANARSVYFPVDGRFEYRACIKWLPHSYDQRATWRAFFNYLALGCFFWALRDWILGQTEEERDAQSMSSRSETATSTRRYSPGEGSGRELKAQERGTRDGMSGRRSRGLGGRLRIFLWVLCLNGTSVAIEALMQRADGTTKLLWLVETHINTRSEDHFGPYAYRGNAASYLNLVWPMALGLWWGAGRRGSRKLRALYNMLLPCSVLMAGAVLLSLSRGGALVCIAAVLATAILILLSLPGRTPWGRIVLIGAGVLFITMALVSGKLTRRIVDSKENLSEGRLPAYKIALVMAKDFPLYGTGPNSFDSVFQLYRISPDEYWPAQLHNDWLETFITFGGVGTFLILMAFILVLRRWFLFGGIGTDGITVAFIWLSLGGCFVHALVDFPLQIYSLLLVVLSACGTLVSLSRH